MDTNTATSLRGVADFFRAQYVAPAGQEASTAGQTSALSAAQLAAYQQILADFNSGLVAARNELGATALSLPDVESAADMGALSTADLLQLLRSEARKTTALLVNTTLEGIAAQEATIAANGVKTDAQLKEADDAMKEAQKLQEILNVVKWVVAGLGFIAAIASGGVAGLAMAGLMVALTLMNEVNVKDEQSTIELFTGWISSQLQANHNMDEADADKLAMGIVVGLQLILTLYAAYKVGVSQGAKAGAGAADDVATAAADKAASAVTAVADDVVVVASKTAADVSKVAADVAVKSATAVADDAAAAAIKAASDAADDIATVAIKNAANVADDAAANILDDVANVADDAAANILDDVANIADDAVATVAGEGAKVPGRSLETIKAAAAIALGVTGITKAGGDAYVGVLNYEAGMANAEVEALKAMLAYLQSILQNEADFIQQLMAISAQLDVGVAEIVNNEFRANENRTGQMYS